MKIYTSYFYQIRNFPRTLIPLSTAVWDPKWYHNNGLQEVVYKDKRNVWVGFRDEDLMPGNECSNLCRGPEHIDICSKTSQGKYGCKFLNTYYEQLCRIDFNKFIKERENLVKTLKKMDQSSEEYDIAFIFHEAPSNPCSERVVVQDWLKEHGIDVKEFSK